MKAYRVETKGYETVIVAAPNAAKARWRCVRQLNEARAQRNEIGRILSWIRLTRAPEFDEKAKEQIAVCVMLGVE